MLHLATIEGVIETRLQCSSLSAPLLSNSSSIPIEHKLARATGSGRALAEVQSLLAKALAATKAAVPAVSELGEKPSVSTALEEVDDAALSELQQAAELDMERQLASLQATTQKTSSAQEADEPTPKR